MYTFYLPGTLLSFTVVDHQYLLNQVELLGRRAQYFVLAEAEIALHKHVWYILDRHTGAMALHKL